MIGQTVYYKLSGSVGLPSTFYAHGSRLLASFGLQANGDIDGHCGGQVNRQAEGLVNGQNSNSPYRWHLCRGNSREDKDHGAHIHTADWDFSPQIITGYVSNKGMHALAAVLRVGFDHVHC